MFFFRNRGIFVWATCINKETQEWEELQKIHGRRVAMIRTLCLRELLGVIKSMCQRIRSRRTTCPKA
jgi:hypothetical protein